MEREFFKQFMLCVIFPLVFEGIFPERRSIAMGGLELAFQIWKKLPDGERVVSPFFEKRESCRLGQSLEPPDKFCKARIRVPPRFVGPYMTYMCPYIGLGLAR